MIEGDNYSGTNILMVLHWESWLSINAACLTVVQLIMQAAQLLYCSV